MAKCLFLKIKKKCDNRRISELFTRDETLVYYFEYKNMPVSVKQIKGMGKVLYSMCLMQTDLLFKYQGQMAVQLIACFTKSMYSLT